MVFLIALFGGFLVFTRAQTETKTIQLHFMTQRKYKI